MTRGWKSIRSMNCRVWNSGWFRRSKPALDSSETHTGKPQR